VLQGQFWELETRTQKLAKEIAVPKQTMETHKLKYKPNWKEVILASEWRNSFDELPGIYVLSDEQGTPYVSAKLLTPESRDRSVFGADERCNEYPPPCGNKDYRQGILRSAWL